MSRPFAVFDIDGTLIRWQLYHALADELARGGQLDAKEFKKVHQARMNWKKRLAADAYKLYEQAMVRQYDAALTSLAVADLEQACRNVLKEYKDQVYTYSRDLIKELRAKNYLLFAVSASQHEIVGQLAEYYGFDDFGGSTYETKNGYFIGKSQILRSERKPIYVKELVKMHAASWQGSLAVGDSESDIPMLSIVEQPIAFNPTQELFDHARQQGWQVVVERKNVIYRLEPGDGSYLLA